MIYGSVCSGIEAATVAWHPLGWQPAFFSEIERYARACLKHHYPDVPLHGDFTTIKGDEYGSVELLVGGTPCQDFSVAGLRAGLAGDRGRLTIEFVHLLARLRPRWFVWENVPGVLSVDEGQAFGIFLGLLGQLGYGFAYRILDAQYFGVAQRRRRVFVIGHLGDWRPAAAVLFESHSLSGDSEPKRASRQTAPTLFASGAGTERTASAGSEADFLIAGTLQSASRESSQRFGADEAAANHVIAHALKAERGDSGYHDPDSETYIAFECQGNGEGAQEDVSPATGGIGYAEEQSPTLGSADNGSTRTPSIANLSVVRRLTPRECERLQGFPDDYTLVPYRRKMSADGPRYRALGNSMAVPVMAWIGRRIDLIESLMEERAS